MSYISGTHQHGTNGSGHRLRTHSCNSHNTTVSSTSGSHLIPNRDSHHQQPHQELRFLKTPKDHQIKDERIVFISGKKAPISIFSSLPYSRRALYGTLRYNH